MTVVILTIMITPIMIALICEALSSVPSSWREGAVALGLNPLRAVRAVTLKAIRPAIVAAAVLATARALGEAVMIQMVSGGKTFIPRPADGPVFFFEPLRTLASAIVDFREGVGSPALSAAVYGFALLLLFSAFALSVTGYLVKLPLRKYQTQRMSTLAPADFPGRRRAERTRAALFADQLALGRPAGAGGRLGSGHRAMCDRGGDRAVHGLSRHPVPAPGPDLQPPTSERRSGRARAGSWTRCSGPRC